MCCFHLCLHLPHRIVYSVHVQRICPRGHDLTIRARAMWCQKYLVAEKVRVATLLYLSDSHHLF